MHTSHPETCGPCRECRHYLAEKGYSLARYLKQGQIPESRGSTMRVAETAISASADLSPETSKDDGQHVLEHRGPVYGGDPFSYDFEEALGRESPEESLQAFKKLSPKVASRDHHRCQRCDKKIHRAKDRGIHHIKPRSEGGPTIMSNLILLCHTCHDFVECFEPPLRTRAAIWGS